ncbi:MAG: glycosyltransferase family 9 protein [Pirellulales bacterium]|nr:glycosyltransferase family 9 protein [Pirellulales bacterium]
MRLGVFLPNWIGDVVMATPALRALRELAGAGSMVGIMRPYVAEVLAGADWFDEEILYVKGGSLRASQAQSFDLPSLNWPRVLQRLRANKFDRVVLLTNSLRTAWMAFRSGAPERVGMVGNLRRPLLTTHVYAPRQNGKRMTLPTISSYLHLAQAAGAAPQAPTLQLATTAEDERAANAVWRRLALPTDGSVAVLNTGGAYGAAKDWPSQNFAQLALQLAEERRLHVLFNCGPAERGAVRDIVERLDHPRIKSLADEPALPIGLTKAVIRRAAALVTTDSGPRFFGVAFGVPTVTLFGPTSVTLTQTGAPHEVCVSLGLDCQPCMSRTCPLVHHRCMRGLSVEQVLAAVDLAVAGRGVDAPLSAA